MSMVATPEDSPDPGITVPSGAALPGPAGLDRFEALGLLPATLAGAGRASDGPARDAQARRHPGDRDRMTLRLFLSV